jgi:hypothetical protein
MKKIIISLLILLSIPIVLLGQNKVTLEKSSKLYELLKPYKIWDVDTLEQCIKIDTICKVNTEKKTFYFTKENKELDPVEIHIVDTTLQIRNSLFPKFPEIISKKQYYFIYDEEVYSDSNLSRLINTWLKLK